MSLRIDAGTTVGVIGPNGCGKSTLLQLVAGVLEPDGGPWSRRGRVTSLLELGAGFSPELTGRENVYLNASLHGVSRDDVHARFDAIVAFAELERFIDMPVRTYSSGMYMRLGFAVAVHLDPEIVLIDEAFAVGDAHFQRKCLHTIRDFQRSGRTIVLVSHDLHLVEQLCSHVALLQQGRLVAAGAPADVIGRYHELDMGRGAARDEPSLGHRRGPDHAASISCATARRRDVLRTRDALTIRLHYRCEAPVDRPVFGVAIHRDDGTHVTGPNTRTSGFPVDRLEGSGAVELRDRSPAAAARPLPGVGRGLRRGPDHRARSSRAADAVRGRRGRHRRAARRHRARRRAGAAPTAAGGRREGQGPEPAMPRHAPRRAAGQEPIDAPFDQYQRYAITTAIARAMGRHAAAARARRRRPPSRLLVPAAAADRRVPARGAVDHRRPRRAAGCPGYLCARAATRCPSRPGSSTWSAASTCSSTCRPRPAPRSSPRSMRVSRRAAVVAAPFRSPVIERAEALVSDFIRDVCGYEQGQLQEHREHGWPDLDESAAAFEAAGWHVRVFGYGSVWTWVLMMIDKHALQAMAGSKRAQIALDRAFNESRFDADREPPCYRQFVVAARVAGRSGAGVRRGGLRRGVARRPSRPAAARSGARSRRCSRCSRRTPPTSGSRRGSSRSGSTGSSPTSRRIARA